VNGQAADGSKLRQRANSPTDERRPTPDDRRPTTDDQLNSKHGEKWVDADKIVTNGPFLLKEWKHDAQVALHRSP
jgi:hypothetical protein